MARSKRTKAELESFTLKIDYSKPLAKSIKTGLLARWLTAGSYIYASPDITEENFPVEKGEAEVEAVLLHLDRAATSNNVLRAMDRQDLRPATMAELVAFGEQHPDEQRQLAIIALGSVWTNQSGYGGVGWLYESPGERRLLIAPSRGQWDAYYRFLAIRK